MERLTLEELARLVDEQPTPAERKALDRDPEARRQLEALQALTAALKDLPAVLPPPAGWDQLRARLVAAGLIRRRPRRFAVSRRWMQAAAALVLFAGGTGFGAAWGPSLGGWLGDSPVGQGGASPGTAVAGALPATSAATAAPSFATVEEARTAVESAEEQWAEAFDAYQRLLRSQGLLPAAPDPASRAHFMELIRTASQTALQESPGDPFLNTVYVSATREQENLLRMASQDFWH